ncbi:MAG: LCP family protein [Clostridia bacterium]|nr:LCP family protein [Clostridia bacterium]
MAKDRRKKTVGTQKRKKKQGRQIITIAASIFLVLFAILVFILVQVLTAGSGEKDKTQSDLNKYDTTPSALQNKVAYYVVGLLGEDETSATEALMFICHDKKKNTLNIMEVPQDTYLGESDLWSVKKAGLVWGNPAPLDWCDFEGKRIFKAEIEDHKKAGHTVSQRTGSASYNLISVFNEQFAMPVDQYFMIPQAGFVKLVNLLGGLDVDLESSLKVGETTYAKGVRTLDGEAALQYVLKRDKGVQGDVNRILRQRKVFLALFQRLCAQNEEQLLNDSLGPVMRGSTPIRVSGELATADMIKLVLDLANVKPADMTVQLLAGKATSHSSQSYYSIGRASLVAQLNAYFNPYGETIVESDLLVTELVQNVEADVHLQVLSELVVEQSGKAEVTSATTTTTSSKTTTTTKKAG